MDELWLVVVIVILVVAMIVAFFSGNFAIIAAICEGDTSYLAEQGFSVFVAVVADLILLFLACKKIIPPISSSFQLMRNGLKNRRIAKKESAKLKKLLENEKLDVNRLEELRDKRISESATKRTLHFCQLIESIAGKEHLQVCLSEVGERQSVLDEIDDIESEILKITESYKNVGDTEKCKYYLDILKSTNIITPEITALENECEALLYSQDVERKAIRLWRGILLWVLAVLAMVSVVLYIEDPPYRRLRFMIENQSLTAEMCDWTNRNSEDSYYNYLTSEKGRKFLAAELTKLHKNDDASKAMWLLCIQPNSINGYDLYASQSFIQWLIGYAKNNGVRSTDQDGPDDSWYNVIYSIDGYQLRMASYNDKESDFSNISGFSVSDGENSITVDSWGRHSNTTPTIE